MTSPKHHPAFQHLRSQPIDSLNLTVEEYEHRETGAKHYHLSSDNSENVFLVALRTLPTDSTGVAHILEHTALCGSEHYPVRDPFFMMIRRSLNTFMNAFTSSDWTAYPFASQNRKDFFNLMDVYLDAVFFSTLHELDFAQEGHRLEFAEADNPDTELQFKGVVFNEMKGAMSSPVSTLWQTLTKYLFPTTTYHHNSGGEPQEIPDLSYAELKAFYRTHYHPSNAILMTSGDIPATEHQQRFEERALSRFQRADKLIVVNDEKRYYAPIAIEESYALEEAEMDGDKTHIVLGWLLGHSTDLQAELRAELLSGVLLDDGAAPLRHALETTDLGTAPSPLCGLENSNREMSFMAGLEGSRPEHAAAVEQLILDTLREVAEKGVPQERVESALHQLELAQREVGGGHYPYGLQLILDALPSAIHYGDPVAALDLDEAIEQLREDIRDTDFIPALIREWFLDNPHRVRLTLKPDTELATRRDADEHARLARIKANLSAEEKQHIVTQAQQLAERQMQEDDADILPKVGLEDVPAEMPIAKGKTDTINDIPCSLYAQGTNGLIYQQVVVSLPQLDDELLAVLPYYTHCLTELGCGQRDYLETQAWQTQVSGGLSAYSSVRGKIDDVQSVSGYLIFSGKALSRNQREFAELLRTSFSDVRFDELPRIRELMAQLRAGCEQSVTGRGHSLAMQAASSGMSPTAALSHRQSGLLGIQTLKSVDDGLNETKNLTALAEKLQRLHQKILASERQFLLIGESQNLTPLMQDTATLWPATPTQDTAPFGLAKVQETVHALWTTSTSVNFCAKAYPTVPVEHPDAAPLTVLAGFLRNGFLHRTIREQGGAYGGGASQDCSTASFRFYSYRDPRLEETLQDFDRAIDWLLNEEHEPRQLEEAILGIIGQLDKPSSPAGEAKDAFHNQLHGRTPEQRQRYRQHLLTVTLEDLKRVGKTYLRAENASIAVIGNPGAAETARSLGLDIHTL
ncbi:MAG: insulinase family protein [Gammaproteobacteria bacterium]|nr:insulinase family protein [Gammaproteobacteria bacterium]MCF6362067.1 insulinase family protein [Gammaproteobacteria bacterium]